MELITRLRLLASMFMIALFLWGCDETEEVKEDKAPNRLAAFEMGFNIDGAEWYILYSPQMPIDNQSSPGVYRLNDAFYMYFDIGIKSPSRLMSVGVVVEIAMNGEPEIGKKYTLENFHGDDTLQWEPGDNDLVMGGFQIIQASSWLKDEPALPEEYRDGYLGLVSSDIENGYIEFESITDSEYINGCKRVECLIEGDIIAYPRVCPEIRRRMELRDCRITLYNVYPKEPKTQYNIGWTTGAVIPFRPGYLKF